VALHIVVQRVLLPIDHLPWMAQIATGPRAHFIKHFRSRSANMARGMW
jgi:hypothetical protein